MSSRRRILNIVLIVSLALNFLVFGGMAARMLWSPDGRPIPPNLFWVLNALDDDTQTRLRPIMQTFSEEMRPLRFALFQAQRDVNALLTEDPLNDAAIATAFEKLRSVGLEYQDLAHRQTLAVFAQLNPEQRVSAMRFIQDRSRPPGDRDRDRGDREEAQAH
jgi:uncharacterized membrane protein